MNFSRFFIFNYKHNNFQFAIHYFCFAVKQSITNMRQFIYLCLFFFIWIEPLWKI